MPASETPSPARQLATFIGRFDPPVRRLIKASRTALRRVYPTANELVYDGYNALAIGFCSADTAGSCLVSIAAYARGVNLYFYNGARLPDPSGRLEGKGNRGRFVRIESADVFDEAPVRQLLRAAARDVTLPLSRTGRSKLIIKSAVPRHRSRTGGGSQ